MSIKKATELLWNTGNLQYLFHEAQLKIFNEIETQHDKEVLLLSSRRFGKSYFSIIYAFIKCIRHKGYKVLVVAPSKIQAKEIIEPIVDWLLGQAPNDSYVKKLRSNFKLQFKNGSILQIAGADYAAESIRGKGFDIAILEESCSWNFETCDYVLRNVIKPTLLHSKSEVKLIHATTPSSKYTDHPFHELIDVIPTIKLSIYDNPLLSEEQIQEAIDDCGGVDSHTFQVEYLCNVTKNENYSVLPNLTKTALHSASELIDAVIVGADEGGVRDNTACVYMAKQRDGKYIITKSKQWVARTTLDEQIGYFRANPYNTLIFDASGQVRVELASKGINVIFPDKLDRDASIKDLDLAFKRGELAIESSLTELYEALQSATWNNRRTDFERTEKYGHCDLLMACVYVWRMRRLLDEACKKKLEEERLALIDHNCVSFWTRPKESSEMKLAQVLKGRRR